MISQNADLLKRIQQLESAGAGRPEDLEFNSLLGSDGLIRDNLKLNNNVNTGYLDQMRQDNLRGPGQASAWRNLMDQQITRQAGDSNAQLQNAQNRQLDNLAMRGGASSGAAERMATAGVGQNLQNQQNIFGNRLQADMSDEQMRQQGLSNLGQAETNYGNIQNTIDMQNRDATTQDVFQQRAFDTNMYNEKMQAWAAQKTAAATPSGGGGKK